MSWSIDDYVCTECFQPLHQCTCTMQPWDLIHIDKGMQDIIRVLNTKWYVTEFCCESHYNETLNIYIKFVIDYKFKELPQGFTYNAKHKTLEMIHSKTETETEFNQIKYDALYRLLIWANDLSPQEEE